MASGVTYEAVNRIDTQDPTIQGRRFPRNFSIISQYWATNPRTKKRDLVRLIKNEPSIWKSEQPEYGTSVKFEKVRFKDGYAIAQENDTRLQEFMELHPQREGSGSKHTPLFRILDPKKVEKEKFQALSTEFKATQIAQTIQGQKFEVLCEAFNVSAETEEGLRTNLYLAARSNPEKFLRVYDDPRSETKYYLSKAEKAGIIQVSVAQDAIRWGDNHVDFMYVPAGYTALDYFASQVHADEKARGLFNTIRARMTEHTPAQVDVEASEEHYNSFDYLSDMPVMDIIKEAKAIGAITTGGKLGKELIFEGQSLGMGLKQSEEFLTQHPSALKRVMLYLAKEQE